MRKDIKIFSFIKFISLAIIAISFILFYAVKIDSNNTRTRTLNSIINENSLLKLKTQKEEEYEIDKNKNIIIRFTNENINVMPTKESKIRIIEKCNKTLSEKEKFKVNEKDNELLIGKENYKNKSFLNNRYEIVEVYLPEKYSEDLVIEANSGNVTFDSLSNLKNVSCETTSGNISGEKLIANNDVKIEATSGNIKIDEIRSKHEIETTSGNISIKSLFGSGNIESTSGCVDIVYNKLDNCSEIETTSGTVNVKMNKNINFQFEGNCSSGEIYSNFDFDYKNKKGNEAYIKTGKDPFIDLKVNTTSGDINITKCKTDN